MRSILFSICIAALSLTACDNSGGKNSAVTDGDSLNREQNISAQFAYVDMDSLVGKYNKYLDLSDVLAKKAEKVEKEVASKRRRLESSVASAQEKISKGLVTRAEAAQLEQSVMQQEQSLYQYGEKMQQELSEENQVMMNNLFHSINTFVREFNADYKYSMIFTTSGGAPILHANPSLNITTTILEGINAEYEKEKKEKK